MLLERLDSVAAGVFPFTFLDLQFEGLIARIIFFSREWQLIPMDVTEVCILA